MDRVAANGKTSCRGKMLFDRLADKSRETINLLRGCLCPRYTNQRRIASMQTAHHSALEAKHAGLDQKIAAEAQRPLPDTALLAALKKQKLKLKEEMTAQ
jgi:hypothetical protein